MKRSFYIAFLLSFIELMNLIVDPVTRIHTTMANYYWAISLLCLLVVLAFIAIIYYTYSCHLLSYRLKNVLIHAFWLVVSMIGAVFVILDIFETQSMMNFFCISFLLLVVPTFNWLTSALCFFIFYGSAAVTIFLAGTGYPILSYIICLFPVCCAFSYHTYHARIKALLSSYTLQSQNKQLDELVLKLDKLSKD